MSSSCVRKMQASSQMYLELGRPMSFAASSRNTISGVGFMRIFWMKTRLVRMCLMFAICTAWRLAGMPAVKFMTAGLRSAIRTPVIVQTAARLFGNITPTYSSDSSQRRRIQRLMRMDFSISMKSGGAWSPFESSYCWVVRRNGWCFAIHANWLWKGRSLRSGMSSVSAASSERMMRIS